MSAPPLATLIRRGDSTPARVIDPPRGVLCAWCKTVVLVYHRISTNPIECPRCTAVLGVRDGWHQAPPILIAREVAYLKGSEDDEA